MFKVMLNTGGGFKTMRTFFVKEDAEQYMSGLAMELLEKQPLAHHDSGAVNHIVMYDAHVMQNLENNEQWILIIVQ